ncbi:transposase [Natronococcus jeotgali]|uniref:Transposase (TCE33) n=1 Tax=Natronococcus jeotgali DSM 18795 TaxID=1227498 RepID=L9XNR2_9EURY|nr:transposase [Natronococcus jeotgali]ELY63021.1 transposase (TCE33) [Natronococcus jeotgali DSM 18795]
MASTQASRRDVFRAVATDSYREWPAYDTTGLYDRSSLGALEEDIQTVASAWFAHEAHNSVDEFICELPLQYADLTPHDQYDKPATYEMRTLTRAFLLKEAYGWDHETALLEYLKDQPVIQQQLDFETLPDQSTLWRTWHCRFSPDLQETIQKSARTVLINANREDINVPRDPLRTSESQEDNRLTDHEVLTHTDEITEQVSHIAYPAFSLNRGDSCEIHPNAFWDLQTYLGLRENLAANEGARSFLYDSQRERTPLGHAHRDHIRGLSIESIREMYHEALQRLIDRVSETDAFHRAGLVAIDTTEAKPFTGDRTGHEDEIPGTKDGEYACQWATIQLVGKAVPLVLDARPIRKGESRRKIVEDLLDSAQDLVHVDRVLMDRAFDSQHILEEIDQRGLGYVVPKRMYTSERAQAKRLLRWDRDRYVTDRKLYLGKNEWHETTLIYRRRENAESTDYTQYSVFMTNCRPGAVHFYNSRWEIESGYKSIKRFMAATTSKSFVLRFFYFAFACLLYSIWRAVDLLVQIELTGEYEQTPLVTAENTLTLLKKETGIG